jgi:hypothetical protein
MHYFAGLFDAEGYVSLCPNGAFTIALEMANEAIPNLFKEEFGGCIYTRKRDKRKKTWTWKINSISDQAIFFIDSISDLSIVKRPQLLRLKDYLNQPRKNRKDTRAITCSTLKAFKQPWLNLTPILPPVKKPIENHFFEWLAGFIDGDGNFVCYEHFNKQTLAKRFAHQLSVANIFPEAIRHINDRISGTVVSCKRPVNTIFKWSPKTIYEKFVCESIYPFLKIKGDQCQLFLEFIQFPKKIRNVDRPIVDRDRMYSLITQIKHLNSI